MSVEQVLKLNPPKNLVFPGPTTKVAISHLSLTNPTNQPVYFKIKTTAPLLYNAYPHIGLIMPGAIENIDFDRQPIVQGDYEDQKDHLFMIQSAYAKDVIIPAEDFWKEASSGIMHTKLEAVFPDVINVLAEHSRFGDYSRMLKEEDWEEPRGRNDEGFQLVQILLIIVAVLLVGIIAGALI